jgi:hypothetical protein
LVAVFYLEFLSKFHERLRPRTYLEIRVAQGYSLAVSRCQSIGIDPELHVTQQLISPSVLIRSTSDDYFAQLASDEATPFGELPVDFGYIDGLHHFEYALRDFIGLERYSATSSVVAFDDILPRNTDEAARERHTQEWTGDVFRVQFALAAHRPDLVQIRVNTEPTGTLLVVGLDPESHALVYQMDDILRTYVTPDPQVLPPEILSRSTTITPERALELTIWDELRESRSDTVPESSGVA